MVMLIAFLFSLGNTGQGKHLCLIIMTNITSTLVEALTLHYSTEWPTGIIGNNESHEVDTLSFIITPLALISKHGKQHHPHLENVSLVLLSSEWTRLTRLIFLTILSVIGSVGNIFMISSVMIEDHLKKAGKRNLFNNFLLTNLEQVFLQNVY